MINPFTTTYRGLEIEVILVNCHYPVTQTDFRLQFGLMVKKIAGLDDATSNVVAQKFTAMFAEAHAGRGIWRNKTPIQNPLLCEEDGPVHQLRRCGYEQFYVDVADIARR